MSAPHVVQPEQAEAIRQVLVDVNDALSSLEMDACDVSDMEELIAMAHAELDSPQPKVATLATYLNSLARSLRTEPSARTVVMELDAVMREAHMPTTWER
ncbi:MAG TPA: hypothetical protein VIL28_10845 [Steroidobacteraceae bacterium]